MKNFIKNLFSKEEKIPLKLGKIHDRGFYYPKRKKIVTKDGSVFKGDYVVILLSQLAAASNLRHKHNLENKDMYELPEVYIGILT